MARRHSWQAVGPSGTHQHHFKTLNKRDQRKEYYALTMGFVSVADIEPRSDWSDLVLSPQGLQVLREGLCTHKDMMHLSLNSLREVLLSPIALTCLREGLVDIKDLTQKMPMWVNFSLTVDSLHFEETIFLSENYAPGRENGYTKYLSQLP